MKSFLRRGIFPVLSLVILMLGNGLLTALLPVRLGHAGVSGFLIASVSTGFALGFVLGSFRIDRLVSKVGHIRAYAGFAAILATTILGLGFTEEASFWVVLRIINGACSAGLCLIIQSWLLSLGTKKNSGRVLSLYMISFYGAQSMGVYLMNLYPVESLLHFSIAAMLCSLSTVPLSFVRLENPPLQTQVPKSIYGLYKISPSGMLGCFGAGAIVGSVYGLLPYYASEQGFPTGEITRIVSLTILGGMTLQYPIGRFSDRWGRRRMMILVSHIAAAVGLVLLFLTGQTAIITTALCFLFGGVAFTIYPLCINYSCDQMKGSDVLAATQGLLLVYNIGAATGPQMASSFMWIMGPKGLIVFFVVMSFGLALFFKWRAKENPIEEEAHGSFVAAPVVQVEKDSQKKE